MRHAVLASAVSALVVAACAGDQIVIDGYPIGDLARCGSGCAREVATATRWLDRTAPGHPRIDHIELHLPDYRTADGSRVLAFRSSGSDYVAVIVLEDGSRHAVAVGCGIGVDPNPCFTSAPGIGSSITIETP